MKSRIILPILIALLTTVLWSASIVYAQDTQAAHTVPTPAPATPLADYKGLGSLENQTDKAKAVQTTRNDLAVLRAYEAFQKKPDDATARALNQAVENATGNKPSPAITAATKDEVARTTVNNTTAVQEKTKPDTIPETPTARAELLKIAEEKEQRATLEYQTVMSDANSEIIARDNAKDTSKSNTAAAVRQLQDVERMKALGCMEKNIPDTSKTLCKSLITEYNSRCPKTDKTPDTCSITPSSSSPPFFTQTQYDAARAAATQRVQQIEQTLNAALKKDMIDQKVEISKILRYRKDDPEILKKQVSALVEGDFLQQSYTGKGIVYFISRIVDSLVLGVGSLAVVALVIGGYLLMFSGADDQKREAGKEVVKYTIIGLILVFSSYAIVSLILGLFYSV